MKKETQGSRPKSIFGLNFLRASTCGINTTGEAAHCAGNTEQSHSIEKYQTGGRMDVWIKGRTMVAIYDVKLDTVEAITGKQQFDVGWRVKESGSGREWSEGWVHTTVGALERCAVRQRYVSASGRDRSKRAKDNRRGSSHAVAASWGTAVTYGLELI